MSFLAVILIIYIGYKIERAYERHMERLEEIAENTRRNNSDDEYIGD